MENGLKAERQTAFNEYFDRKCRETGIDFVVPEQVGVKITLSGSAESYKQAADAFFDKVMSELSTIDKMTDKNEILYEYKQTLNLGQAIAAVTNRKAALNFAEAEKSVPTVEEAKTVDDLPDFPGDLDDLPPLPEEPTIFEEPEKDYYIHVVCGKSAFVGLAKYLDSMCLKWEVKENEI